MQHCYTMLTRFSLLVALYRERQSPCSTTYYNIISSQTFCGGYFQQKMQLWLATKEDFPKFAQWLGWAQFQKSSWNSGFQLTFERTLFCHQNKNWAQLMLLILGVIICFEMRASARVNWISHRYYFLSVDIWAHTII